MKVCIIGGGLAGLCAALRLKDRHEVDIFEKRGHLGGCLSSHRIDDYWIEQFYHHCFSGDRHLLSLFSRLNISDRLEWRKGTSGYFAQDTIYPLNTPLEILRYPLLSTIDKLRLALLMMRSKRTDPAGLDDITAKDYILSEVGQRTYESFFEPLLKSKFGEMSGRVSAAWLIGRIAIRSDRGLSGERLGYLRGGFQVFLDALSAEVGRDCTIRLQDPVTLVSRNSEGWRVNGQRYDAVLSTIPPQALTPLGGPALPPVPYQGAACLTLGMEDDYTNGIYWLNIKEPGSFGAVITHTNFVPFERYGERIVYLASYFSGTLPGQAGTLMRDEFCKRFSLPSSEVHWERLAVEPMAGPVFTTGYRKLIPHYQEKGLFFAGMFSPSNYPERSMEGSVSAGYHAAKALSEGNP
ncbi:MAG: NAD(P)/FAD-dependent oxidoreductase [Methanoregulaceae archaeon]|jgi:protoporphyrinogen oxidase|nr:NAD(P)/FAD-dependent oxidoreductase [Methanoregulaceae archaeon]MCU0629204.1 NAD(P)/FAD-dependent oxidoreductase [Methanoregulaceae archaeon]